MKEDLRKMVLPLFLLAGVSASTGPAWSQLPWSFAENAGQYEPAVRFRAVGGEAAVDFKSKEVVFQAAEGQAVRLSFAGSNPQARIESLEKAGGKAHFYHGDDRSRWVTDVPLHEAITYRDLYPGVALDYRADGKRLKSEMRLAPGADPSQIVLRYSGAEQVRLSAEGSLVVRVASATGGAAGEWTESPPVAWQTIDGKRVPVEARYQLLGAGRVGFELGDWDPRHELVIDPVIQYSTFLGGGGSGAAGVDSATSIVRDIDDNWLISGMTRSTSFAPVSLSFFTPFQSTKSSPANGTNAAREIFVAKLTHDLTRVIYATYLGGNNRELTSDITVDPQGYAYVTGWTLSQNFPTLACGQCSHAGGGDDAVVVKLKSDGSLVYSTYLGSGSDDQPEDIAVDASGNVYVTGGTNSPSFPNPGSPWFSGYTVAVGSCVGWNTFVTKLDVTATSVLYSTCLGGSGVDHGRALVHDPASGNVHVTGYTESSDFPTIYSGSCSFPPCPASPTGSRDVFVATLDLTGNPTMSTYFGGSDVDQVRDIAYQNNVLYVTGDTQSADFPMANAMMPFFQGGVLDAFVSAIAAQGTGFAYSTYLGGNDNDGGRGIVMAPPGGIWVTGYTGSGNFPLVNPIQGLNGTTDAFLTHIDSPGTSIFYLSTYVGGSGDDAAYDLATYNDYLICLVGATGSANFPMSGAFPGAQGTYAGGDRDGFATCVSLL